MTTSQSKTDSFVTDIHIDLGAGAYDAVLSLCADRARLGVYFLSNGATPESRLNGLDFIAAAGAYARYLTFEEVCDIVDAALEYGTFSA